MFSTVRKHGFTLVEILIIVVILGIISALVIPKFAGACEDTKLTALKANLSFIREAVERYCIEHAGRPPILNHNGNVTTSQMLNRLTNKTTREGKIDTDGKCGPYFNSLPVNPFNNKSDIRFDGAPAGAGTGGWHVDTSTGRISADDSPEHASL